jgi:hypothetical protein
VTGGGGGAMTVQVAAYNATADSKEKADFVCTGADDELVIQQAIDRIASSGGEVALSEGDFFCSVSSGSAIDLASGVNLRGMNMANTWIEATGTGATGRYLIEARGFNSIRDLNIIASTSSPTVGGVRVSSSGWVAIDRVFAYGADQPTFDVRGNNFRLTRSYAENIEGSVVAISASLLQIFITSNMLWSTGTPLAASDSAIYASSSVRDLWIHDCYILGGWHSVFIDGGTGLPGRIHIHNNYIHDPYASAIVVSNNTTSPPAFVNIHDNQCLGAGWGLDGTEGLGHIELVAGGASDPLTETGDEFGVFIHHNSIEAGSEVHGIKLSGMGGVHVKDNYIETPGLHGIYLIDTISSHIHGNIIRIPSADVTYDGIHIDADSDSNDIRGNTVFDRSTSPARAWRYGINILGDDNLIVGNDMREADAGTAPINKGGTGNLYDWPAHATYGDNFT